VVGYMKDFLFAPEQARTPLRVLSGGERGRLMLARALAKPSNVLVLDEPTNDLDLETLDVLEEMLSEYSGTVILISHDRDFLDRVVHMVIAPQGDGRWVEYAGGYSDMLALRDSRPETKSPPKPKPSAPAPAARSGRSGKPRLSFKDQHALKTLPAQIASLQTRVAQLQRRLEEPDLYARDAKAFVETTEALAGAQSELASAEEQWLELEILREEIESG
jgi:ATP-binding cassette subfamily F protein uup